MGNPLKDLSPALLAKIGSIVGHAEEMMSPGGHHFDRIAMDALCSDPEVQAWLTDMRELAMVPQPRSRR